MNSIFELFKIGVGPSSSHTVGPMIAAQRFALQWAADGSVVENTRRIQIDLYGSLALTGRGHATDSAVIAGLSGLHPATVDPATLARTVAAVRSQERIIVHCPEKSPQTLPFHESTDLIFNRSESLDYHPNAMRFSALDDAEKVVFTDQYYSVGGGFVVSEAEVQGSRSTPDPPGVDCPFAFTSSAELLQMCESSGMEIADIVNRNELVWRSQAEIDV